MLLLQRQERGAEAAMADGKEPYRELYMAKSMEELNSKTSAKKMECSTPKL